jgi:excisionase family DNA binding protein
MNTVHRPAVAQGHGNHGHRTVHTAPNRLLTVKQAAEYMNTTVRFVRRLIAERRIAFVKLGRHVRISTSDIDAFVTAGRVEPLTAEDVWSGLRKAVA